jgi:H+/Cl- antiporter ClcA
VIILSRRKCRIAHLPRKFGVDSMEKRITEETVLFISVLKWIVLATVVGGMVGVSTTIFLETLGWSIAYMDQLPHSFFVLPVALFLSGVLIKYLAPDAEGQGTDKVIEAVHKRAGKINAMVVPVKLVATVLTIASGGSAGKIGPCAQIGGGLSSLFADLLHFDDRDRRKLVICGISAGFASVFGTPIAGAIFGVEVLFVGSILYDVLLPSFVAGIVGYQVASGLGVTYFHSPLKFAPVFSHSFFIEVVVGGIFFGLCSFLLIEILRFGKKIADKIPWGLPWKGVIGGFILVGLTLLYSKQYLGLGLETIQSSLEGQGGHWYAFILKMVFTSMTLNFAGSGGIVVPILFIGATAGALIGEILQANIATFSAIGFVSLLAGATNTPIAASILSLELFGSEIAPYAAIACVISFLMTGHRSVHLTQVLAVRKSTSIQAEIGNELKDVRAEFKPRSRSVIGAGLRLIKTIRKKRPS